ncbi:MAG: hypothetical protein MZU91_08150 [Desulfosudis oleivorans]|nr:hypothetical protein [Desulfosudis oleivorans]
MRHQPGVRAHPERLGPDHGPPGPALGRQGAEEDRLAPVRGLARHQPLRATATAPRCAACTPSRTP